MTDEENQEQMYEEERRESLLGWKGERAGGWKDLCWADAATVLESIDPDWRDHWSADDVGVDNGLAFYSPSIDQIKEALA